eukprot:3027666-Amphidinium_carterae.3
MRVLHGLALAHLCQAQDAGITCSVRLVTHTHCANTALAVTSGGVVGTLYIEGKGGRYLIMSWTL